MTSSSSVRTVGSTSGPILALLLRITLRCMCLLSRALFMIYGVIIILLEVRTGGGVQAEMIK